MMKPRITGVLTFLVYCIPWAFVLMYWDRQYDMLLIYPLLVLGYAVLGWYCGKANRVPLAVTGSLVSCTLSLLLAYRYLWEQAYYFAPLGIAGMVSFLFAFTLSVQLILWRIQRRGKEAPLFLQFFEAAATVFVPTVIFIFAMLLLSRFW